MKEALKLRLRKSLQFSSIEKDLLSIYNEEYNDIYQNIVKDSKETFLQHLANRVILAIKSKHLDYSKEIIEKMLKHFIDAIYLDELAKANAVFLQVKENVNQISLEIKVAPSVDLQYLNFNYLKHCKEGKVALHTCGRKPLLFNDKQNLNSYIICLMCKMIYKPTLIKLQCDNCDNEFYTKTIIPKENLEQYQQATWLKYHCNAVINDKMKCVQCKEVLYYDKCNNIIKCFKCKFCSQPENVDWKCIVCGSLFNSGAKDYNPLDYKMMKLSVKEALINKEYATPEQIPCCKYTEKEMRILVFAHKRSCCGKMLKGKMNKRDIVVCSKCQLINYYDCYSWKCPKCQKKFKLKNLLGNNNDDEPQILRQNSKNYSTSKSNPPLSSHHIVSKSSKKITQELYKKSSLFGNCENKQKKSDSKCHIEIIQKDFIEKEISHSPETKRNSQQDNFYLALQKDLQSQLSQVNLTLYKIQDKIPSIPFISKQKDILLSFGSKSTYHSDKNSTLNNQSINSTRNFDFDADDYEIISQIGQGTFGQIYLVESPKTKDRFAMKKLVASSSQEIQKRTKEYEILISLSSNKDSLAIVSVIAMQTKQLDPTTFVMYVLMELASCDWDNEIIERNIIKNYYKEEELLNHLECIIRTLSELQKMNISHRDIKPANILLFKKTNQLKISDFDEAKTHNEGMKQTIRGTELFMSPMLITAYRNRSTCSLEHNLYKSDLFSLGLCFIYAAVLSYQPIYEIRDRDDSNEIHQIVTKYLKKNYGKSFISLLVTMIETDEKSRCDFIQFEEYLNSYQSKKQINKIYLHQEKKRSNSIGL